MSFLPRYKEKKEEKWSTTPPTYDVTSPNKYTCATFCKGILLIVIKN